MRKANVCCPTANAAKFHSDRFGIITVHLVSKRSIKKKKRQKEESENFMVQRFGCVEISA